MVPGYCLIVTYLSYHSEYLISKGIEKANKIHLWRECMILNRLTQNDSVANDSEIILYKYLIAIAEYL